jgi:hypothetical protein
MTAPRREEEPLGTAELGENAADDTPAAGGDDESDS